MKQQNVLCLILCILFCCCACDTYSVTKQYPWYIAEEWYCEEIDMTMSFSTRENGRLSGDVVSYLSWKGQKIKVFVGFQASNIGFLVEDSQNVALRTVLDGTWSYVGNKMVITNFGESLFEGEVDSLTFIPICE